MKLTLEIHRRRPANLNPWRHPDDRQVSWVPRPAPLLEVELPWGPDEPGNWHPRHWHLYFLRGSRSWPALQIGIGPLYIRAWRRGTIIWWSGHKPVFNALSTQAP
jgi:hypothetical protein